MPTCIWCCSKVEVWLPVTQCEKTELQNLIQTIIRLHMMWTHLSFIIIRSDFFCEHQILLHNFISQINWFVILLPQIPPARFDLRLTRLIDRILFSRFSVSLNFYETYWWDTQNCNSPWKTSFCSGLTPHRCLYLLLCYGCIAGGGLVAQGAQSTDSL